MGMQNNIYVTNLSLSYWPVLKGQSSGVCLHGFTLKQLEQFGDPEFLGELSGGDIGWVVTLPWGELYAREPAA